MNFDCKQQSPSNQQAQSPLLQILLDFHKTLIALPNPKMIEIHNRFIETQKAVIEVVEHRIGLQAILTQQDIKAQYTDKITALFDRFEVYERQIKELALKIRQQHAHILQLQQSIYESGVQKKLQAAQQQSINTISTLSQNIEDLTSSIVHFTDHHHNQTHDIQVNGALSHANFMESKQMNHLQQSQALRNKSEMLRLKQQIMTQTDRNKSQYTCSLKQSVQLYEQIICARNYSEQKEADLLTRLKATEKTGLDLSDRLNSSSDQLLSKYERQIVELRTIITSKQQEIDQIIKNSEKCNKEHQLQIARLTEDLQCAQQQHYSDKIQATKELNQRKNEIITLTECTKKLSESITLKQQQISLKDNTISQLSVEITVLRQLLRKQEQNQQQLRALQHKYKQTISQNEQLKKIVERESQIGVKLNQDHINHTNSLLSSLNLQKQSLQSCNRKLREQSQAELELIDSLNQQIVRQKVINRQLESQIQQKSLEQYQFQELKCQLEQEIQQSWVHCNKQLDKFISRIHLQLQNSTHKSIDLRND